MSAMARKNARVWRLVPGAIVHAKVAIAYHSLFNFIHESSDFLQTTASFIQIKLSIKCASARFFNVLSTFLVSFLFCFVERIDNANK